MSVFGKIYKITTFGESHAKSVGVVIEGIPPKMKLSEKPKKTIRIDSMAAWEEMQM